MVDVWQIFGRYTFFYKQPHFRVGPRVAIKIPKMRLSCYEVAKYIWTRGSTLLKVVWQVLDQMYGKQAKIGKIDESC